MNISGLAHKKTPDGVKPPGVSLGRKRGYNATRKRSVKWIVTLGHLLVNVSRSLAEMAVHLPLVEVAAAPRSGCGDCDLVPAATLSAA